MKNIVSYKWGESEGPVDDPEFIESMIQESIEANDIMQLNKNHLTSFNIKEEDEDKIFYAYAEDMDIDEEGIAVKLAYAVEI